MTRLLALVIVASLLLGPGAIAADKPSPLQNLNDEAVLSAARKNIFEMSYSELASLRTYFGHCTDQFSSDLQLRHLCDAAREEYWIEFGVGGRAIDQLFVAIWGLVYVVRSQQGAHKDSDPKQIIRLSKVEGSLKEAMTLQFAILRGLSRTEGR
jgi:hypothetical protein